MRLIQIEHNPTRRQLIVFGCCWLVFIGIAGFILQEQGVSRFALILIWGVAAGIPLVGIFVPEVLRWCYVGLSYLTYPIGFVLSHIILGIVYYLVVTPIGVVMRIFGYDPLNRKFDSETSSYWIKRDSKTEMKRYFRQF